MEYFKFPKKSYYLTQGYGDDSYSHKGRIALDVSAAGGGYKEIYAPFTGYVAKTYINPKYAYTCWLVSDEKVICADGIARYAVCEFTHPVEIAKLKIGQKFKQGDFLMNDGDTGQATGKHLDFETAVWDNKDDIVADWKTNSYGNLALVNVCDPTTVMVLENDCKVLNESYLSKNYHFKKESEVVIRPISEKYTIGTYQAVYDVAIRKGASTKYPQKKVKDLTKDGQKNATSTNPNDLARYKPGTLFDALEIIENAPNDIWARGYSGYINIVSGQWQNSKKVN